MERQHPNAEGDKQRPALMVMLFIALVFNSSLLPCYEDERATASNV